MPRRLNLILYDAVNPPRPTRLAERPRIPAADDIAAPQMGARRARARGARLLWGVPRLWSQSGRMAVIDPYGPPEYLVFSEQIERISVSLYAVESDDFPQYAKAFPKRLGPQTPDLPGNLVLAETVTVGPDDDGVSTTRVDVGLALRAGRGSAIVLASPADPGLDKQPGHRILQWVQTTTIGLDAFLDEDSLLVWATSLRDGAPLEGAEVYFLGADWSVTTDRQGLAVLPFDDDSEAKYYDVLVARAGGDVAVLEGPASYRGYGGWVRSEPPSRHRWHIIPDRPVCRPGDTLRLKGWVRRINAEKGGGIEHPRVSAVDYSLREASDDSSTCGSVPLDELGGFDLAVTVPASADAGRTYVSMKPSGDLSRLESESQSHWFDVVACELPEIAVAVEAELIWLGYRDRTISAVVSGPAPAAGTNVVWTVAVSPVWFDPPGHRDFTFSRPHREGCIFSPPEPEVFSFEGRTDADGTHRLGLRLSPGDEIAPLEVRLEASVIDAGGRRGVGAVRALLHPAAVYVGLRHRGERLGAGEPTRADVIVLDHEGRPVLGRPVTLSVEGDGEFVSGNTASARRLEVVSEESPVPFTFVAHDEWVTLVAEVLDSGSNRGEARLRIWARGPDDADGDRARAEAVYLRLDPAAAEPGIAVDAIVTAPFAPAEGLLTLHRSGIVRCERFTLDERSTTLRFPVTEADVPRLVARVDLVGSVDTVPLKAGGEPSLQRRPAWAAGERALVVSAESLRLAVDIVSVLVEQEDAGSFATITVAVCDLRGAPATGAECCLVVADEVLFAFEDAGPMDPMTFFYDRAGYSGTSYHLRALIQKSGASDLEDELERTGGADVLASRIGPNRETPAPERGAHGWSEMLPRLAVDGHGYARARVLLPNTGAAYRVRAYAAEGAARFGYGESAFRVEV